MPVITGGKIIEGSRQRYRQAGPDVGYGPYYSSGTPANGDFNNVAQPGALLEAGTGILYQNTGTLAATVWTNIGNLK
jgi:hypothetical protein